MASSLRDDHTCKAEPRAVRAQALPRVPPERGLGRARLLGFQRRPAPVVLVATGGAGATNRTKGLRINNIYETTRLWFAGRTV